MLLTIERVLILKSVDIFSQVPDFELAEIAEVLEVEEYHPGDQIIKEDEMGTQLYVIVEGEVSVQKAGRELARMGKLEVVGELSALDPEPRSADVFAETDVLLFRIEGEVLYELMLDHMGVARGVIGVLCKRIREGSRSK